ncbi:c-type cytochrome [Consotaella salsifontis]|uniref:Ubiquinol-cytochrome c reductase cytochrome c subunit n=1 Tax=Consotaella salsifontis TaxID=1365950 RepID=A0A1T4MTS4_9HYPH|nr:c-type cytochrome [Consotaella salsifontis]SJZ70392.1 ubiquinol-cytochrome c reductase cytochrome c subunit [Consotaella salsifontis]
MSFRIRGAAAALFIAVLAVPLPALADEDGAELFRSTCADCHGAKGDQRALGQSRPIATLDAATITETLIARRAAPRTMQDRVKAALTDDEVKALADYVSSLGGGS